MLFVNVNYALNDVYRVERSAIEQVVTKVFKNVQNSKLINCDVDMGLSANDISIKIRASISKETEFKGVLEKVTTRVEQLVMNLVNSRPKNITVEISEIN